MGADDEQAANKAAAAEATLVTIEKPPSKKVRKSSNSVGSKALEASPSPSDSQGDAAPADAPPEGKSPPADNPIAWDPYMLGDAAEEAPVVEAPRTARKEA